MAPRQLSQDQRAGGVIVLKRGWGVLFLLILTLVLAMITGRELLFSLAYMLAALFLLSFLISLLNIYWLGLERHTRTRRSQVTKPAVEDFVLYNHSVLPKLWLEVRDFSTLPLHRASRILNAIGPKQQRIWNIRTVCTRRGRFTLGPLTLRSGDPFGLFSLQRSLPETRSIVVYPPTIDLPHFPLPFGEISGGEALRRRTHHVTDNVSGIRDYLVGDSFNRIHWKSTARTGRLISKEFELDPTTDIWLFLDMDFGAHVASPFYRENMEDELPPMFLNRQDLLKIIPTTEEYGVTIAASLANHFLLAGRAVGLVAYGNSREVIQADRGSRQLSRLLETLAVLDARGGLPFHQILLAEGERLARGTTVIAITPSTDLEWIKSVRLLSRRGLRTVAVLIQADSFTVAPPIKPLVAELAMSHIRTFRVRCDDDIAEVLGAPLGYFASEQRTHAGI